MRPISPVESTIFSITKHLSGPAQTFNVTFQPGVDVTNASVSFTEPYIFDQPYSNTDEAYYRQFDREAWYERKAGGSISLGKQFNYIWSGAVTLQAEDVKVGGIEQFYPLYQRTDVIDPNTHEPAVSPTNGHVETELRMSPAHRRFSPPPVTTRSLISVFSFVATTPTAVHLLTPALKPL